MSLIKFAAAALGLAALSFAAPANAQAGSSAVAVVDFNRVFAESAAGKDAQAKLKAIADSINAELKPDATALETTQKALAPRLDGKTPEQQEDELKKDKALSTQYTTFMQKRAQLAQKSQLRSQEMEATRQKAFGDVVQAAGPDITAAMQAKGAVVVMDRESVAIMAPQADVTTDVITRFSNRIKSVPVAKVDLTKQAQ
jgi:Skp family chaperone for outer membrane proteins